MKISRRSFVVGGAGLLSAVAAMPRAARSETAANLSESDPMAKSLGYRDDAATVDKTAYPKYQAGQQCASCQLYQGQPGEARGPCPLYQHKLVSAKGWCSAWVQRHGAAEVH